MERHASRDLIESRFRACLQARTTAETDEDYFERELALQTALAALSSGELDKQIKAKGENAKKILDFKDENLGAQAGGSPRKSTASVRSVQVPFWFVNLVICFACKPLVHAESG